MRRVMIAFVISISEPHQSKLVTEMTEFLSDIQAFGCGIWLPWSLSRAYIDRFSDNDGHHSYDSEAFERGRHEWLLNKSQQHVPPGSNLNSTVGALA